MVIAESTRRLLASADACLPKMVRTLRAMVEQESPSFNKAAVDTLGQWLATEFAGRGAKIRFHKAKNFGNHLQAEFPGARGRKPVLLLGHFDTVWDVGTLATMPWREQRGRLWGPGVLDMKSGIAQMMFAVDMLTELHGALPRPATVLLVTDEEVGSESSRAITERVAKQSAAVLVCEPAFGPEGKLKTARKGVGDFTVHVRGTASHAGLEPEKGQSAIVELARQIVRIAEFTEMNRGLTVNPGVVRGGTRTNVVAAEAVCEVDVRIARKADAARIEKKFRALRPVNRRCQLEVTGGVNRPPFERTKDVARLFGIARDIGAEMGINLEECAVGGGSDGNFTVALGIPTLDGLGAVGEGAHAVHECVVVDQLPRRTALLASLISRLE